MVESKRVEGSEAGARESRVSPRAGCGYLCAASWLGLVIGLVEVGMLVLEKQNNHVSSIGALHLNRHYPWMVPASQLAIFGAIGLGLELLRRTRPGLACRFGPRVLAALALVALLMTIRQLDTIACVLLACGLATQLLPRFARLAPGFRRVVGVSLPILVATLAVLVVGRHVQLALAGRPAASKPAPEGSPNVLFIVLDTVRARSLGLYGYARDNTPRLSELAGRGVGFAHARAAAPWTLPSHATMFTGRWPGELFEHPEQGLDPSATTLAEHLGRNGYATAGFVANTFYCNAGFGLARGFDHYEDFYEDFDTTAGEVLRHSGLGRRLVGLMGDEDLAPADGRKDADRINADFLAWHSECDDRPFFAFLNYLDAHAPYILPPGNNHKHFGRTPTTPADVELLNAWQKRNAPPTDPLELELARDAYDDCIAYLDAALGRLFDELGRRGVLDKTLVIVTADHGEEIGEHQLVGHGRSLYRDELHVPLLIVKPGRVPSGRVVFEPVSLRDLPATVVDLVGLPGRSPFPGRSMAPLWSGTPGSSKPSPGVVRSEVALREKATRKKDRPPALRGPMVSVIAEGLTYIRNADNSEELYRLVEDPDEAHDLAGDLAFAQPLGRLRALANADGRDEPACDGITASNSKGR